MGLSFTSSTESYSARVRSEGKIVWNKISSLLGISPKNISLNSKDKVLQNKSNLEGNGWLPYQLRYVWKAIFRVMCVDKLVLDNLDRHLWAGHHGHQDMCCRTSWNGDEDFDKVWLLLAPATGWWCVIAAERCPAPWRQRVIAHTRLPGAGTEAVLPKYLGFTVRFRDRW